jgi:hypothetical protein
MNKRLLKLRFLVAAYERETSSKGFANIKTLQNDHSVFLEF